MLIATLPTFTSDESLLLSEKILSHEFIYGARYNTGGASPFEPEEILSRLKPIADRCGKRLYVDLEGRQVRIAHWTPFSAESVVMNRDFEIELPGQIYFRGLGWFPIVNVLPEERRIFFSAPSGSSKYYLGESQSTHIVAKEFKVKGYLNGKDKEYISAAIANDLSSFMLSFVESMNDLLDFGFVYGVGAPNPELVIKIESIEGVNFVKKLPRSFTKKVTLMAARDDLFLAHINRRPDFLGALSLIIQRDHKAILASKIMSGLESGYEISLGDIADTALMSKMGYRNFMLSDELSKKFDLAMREWAWLKPADDGQRQ